MRLPHADTGIRQILLSNVKVSQSLMSRIRSILLEVCVYVCVRACVHRAPAKTVTAQLRICVDLNETVVYGDRTIILEWILERQDEKLWIGSIWLRLGTSGGLL